MKKLLTVSTLAIALAFSANASPDKNKNHHKHDHKDQVKIDLNRYDDDWRSSYKRNGPPAHAPAHGYRNKTGDDDYNRDRRNDGVLEDIGEVLDNVVN